MQNKGPPKSITVEDSFKDCSSIQSAEHVIRVLAPDLLARMVEDCQVCSCAWALFFALFAASCVVCRLRGMYW